MSSTHYCCYLQLSQFFGIGRAFLGYVKHNRLHKFRVKLYPSKQVCIPFTLLQTLISILSIHLLKVWTFHTLFFSVVRWYITIYSTTNTIMISQQHPSLIFFFFIWIDLMTDNIKKFQYSLLNFACTYFFLLHVKLWLAMMLTFLLFDIFWRFCCSLLCQNW